MYIYIALTIWYMATINGIQMVKNILSNIALKSVINPNPVWWNRHIRFPRELFGMKQLSHLVIDGRRMFWTPPKDLA